MASPTPVYYKQNRLKQLRAFCHAAQTGSISEAAEKIFLSQPTVSLQIQALERELETTLFERRGPKIRLTPEGKILFKLSQPLVEGMDKLHETFAAQQGLLESGELNIAAGESTILYIMPGPLRRFMELHPKIRVKLHNVTGGRDGLSRLRADEADFAVGSMIDVPDDILYRPMVTYNPALIVPPDHPLAGRDRVSLEDISPYGLILPPPSLTTWRMVDLVFRQHELKFKMALEAGGWEVIKRYVELGLGIAIVTDVCLTGDERLVKFPLDDYFPKRTYGIVLRRGKYLSPQASRFITLLEEYYAEREADRPGPEEPKGG
ncbi:MAG: LysR family transcriptional regulator [Candidatus Sedimenticola endophacoides]|uniref:LysR family transcriptional regulator n=1 Tax=Candidatus Sedimenticola endophacoides TaxID=2548426 RepID=A0A657PRG0_9GAMM|nr:MAG: LysR family transcriptional regulator [Candidatus Sedimenticola endophacoides]OQX33206.1 MAG: LysR family transcriptional regulator [Candidatus Sedimenticola endophacoides]OQX39770.1 MAG: LysR family transcriptional regulator [Candidatus Sedimenticola endophacoides]OQX40349.1 MAG: LysR family transcriptional regulator [Candidatus Sedimenticola endophacoides]OQX45442.1 MAG: LysR family transcriptional regulator [Candidatus Sedimenticola endophacoides]